MFCSSCFAPGIARQRLVGDRLEPQDGQPRRNERGGQAGQGQPPLARPQERVAAQGQEQEQRVRRMDERQGAEDRRRAGERRARARLDPAEEQDERSRDEQLPRGRARQGERGVRAAVPGAEAEDGERGEQHRPARPGGAEERDARLPGEDAGERREQRRLVPDDRAGIDLRDPRDEREEAVPQRKGVAGVQAAVLELVDRAQVQVAERDELPHPRLVERPVSRHRPLDVPEQPAQHDPAQPDEPSAHGCESDSRPGARPAPEAAPRGRSTQISTSSEHRQPDAPVHREDHRPRDEERRQSPREHRGARPLAERPCNGGARSKHDRPCRCARRR